MQFQKGDYFIFGKETKGLEEHLIKSNDARAIKIPMFGLTRSLNLATCVAIILYEGLRQIANNQ